jgi:hypothetical protein
MAPTYHAQKAQLQQQQRKQGDNQAAKPNNAKLTALGLLKHVI